MRESKTLQALADLQDFLQAALILLSSVTIFVLVLTRYLFDYSDASVEMIARYFAIWGTYLGLSTAHRIGFSIRFSVLEYILPERAQRGLAIVVGTFSMLACAALAWGGWELLVETRALGETMQTGFALPLWIPRAAVAVGGLLLAAQLGLDVWRLILGERGQRVGYGGH